MTSKYRGRSPSRDSIGENRSRNSRPPRPRSPYRSWGSRSPPRKTTRFRSPDRSIRKEGYPNPQSVISDRPGINRSTSTTTTRPSPTESPKEGGPRRRTDTVDPRVPSRLDTKTPTVTNARAPASAALDTQDPRKTLTNGTSSDKQPQSSDIVSILNNLFDEASAVGAVKVEAERAQALLRRNNAEEQKYQPLASNFPSTIDQQNDGKRRISETIQRVNTKLMIHNKQKEALLSSFRAQMTQVKAFPPPSQQSTPKDSLNKLLEEHSASLQNMAASLDARKLEKESMKKLESECADLKIKLESIAAENNSAVETQAKAASDVTMIKGKLKSLDHKILDLEALEVRLGSLTDLTTQVSDGQQKYKEELDQKISNAVVAGSLSLVEDTINDLSRKMAELLQREDTASLRLSLNGRLEAMGKDQDGRDEMIAGEMEAVREQHEKAIQKIEEEFTSLKRHLKDVIDTQNQANLRIDTAQNTASAAASTPAPPPLQPDARIAEIQKQTITTSTTILDLQKKLGAFDALLRSTVDETKGLIGTVKALDYRYNNLSTEPIVKNVMTEMQNQIPNHLSQVQNDIGLIKRDLTELHEKSDGPLTAVQGIATKMTAIEDSHRSISHTLAGLDTRLVTVQERVSSSKIRETQSEAQLASLETRLNQDQGRRTELSLQFREERHELDQRSEELTKVVEKLRNDIEDHEYRILRLEKHFKMGAAPIRTEPAESSDASPAPSARTQKSSKASPAPAASQANPAPMKRTMLTQKKRKRTEEDGGYRG